MRNQLARMRTERGWTQARLADELAVSRQTVISIEKGKYDPSLPLAFRIAAIFGVLIEDIFSPDPAKASNAASAQFRRSSQGERASATDLTAHASEGDEAVGLRMPGAPADTSVS